MKTTATIVLKVIGAAAFAWLVSVTDHTFLSFAISAAVLAASAWGIGKLENDKARRA